MNTHANLNITNLWDLLRLSGFNLWPAQQVSISLTDDEYCGDPTEEIASYQPGPTSATSLSPDPGPEEFEHDYTWFLS